MEEFHYKYAQNLTSNDINDLSETLTLMRFNLKEELDIFMYIKNTIINDNPLLKYLEIINKLEALLLKDIEKIGEFIILIERKVIQGIDNKVYHRYEFLRESYNDTLLNIQKVNCFMIKVIESSTDLLNIRVKFVSERKCLGNILNQKKDVFTFPEEIKKKNTVYEGSEMLDKLNFEIEALNRKKNDLYPEHNHNLEDSYSVDKEIDLLSTIRIKKKPPSVTEPSKEKNIKKSKNSSTSSSSNSARQLSNKQIDKVSKLSLDNLKKLNIETEKIREFCKEIERSLNDNCVMDNEKKNHEKLKNEIIRISSEVTNLKDDIKDFKKELIYYVKKLEYLEFENKSLRQRNYNLFSFANNFTTNLHPTHNERKEPNESKLVNTHKKAVPRILIQKLD